MHDICLHGGVYIIWFNFIYIYIYTGKNPKKIKLKSHRSNKNEVTGRKQILNKFKMLEHNSKLMQ